MLKIYLLPESIWEARAQLHYACDLLTAINLPQSKVLLGGVDIFSETTSSFVLINLPLRKILQGPDPDKICRKLLDYPCFLISVFFSSIKLSGVLKLSVVTGQSCGCFVSHAGPRHQSWFPFNCGANSPLDPRSAGFSSVEQYAQFSLLLSFKMFTRLLCGPRTVSTHLCFESN